MDRVSVFFGDTAKTAWAGQFNLDLMCILSALWVAWRHRFSAASLALCLLALFHGTLFLGVYLLIESTRIGVDLRALLLGSRQHAR